MRHMPQDRENWGRFWLAALGTTVLGLAFSFVEFGGARRVQRVCGQWPEVVFLLYTAALGIYSVHLLVRGRILLGAIGLIHFRSGSLLKSTHSGQIESDLSGCRDTNNIVVFGPVP